MMEEPKAIETQKPAEAKPRPLVDPAKAALNKTLETAAWGAFLILLGASWLVPASQVKDGWWSIGLGVIWLGLNFARLRNGLRMSVFTTFLGVLAIAAGVVGLLFKTDVDFAVFLMVAGAFLIFKPFFDKRDLFGKAEQS